MAMATSTNYSAFRYDSHLSRNPVIRRINKWSRRLHRWGAALIALPLVLVIGTGILLQVKKQVPWVQPPTLRGSAQVPTIELERFLQIARGVPEAAIDAWADIERIDIQPRRGIAKIISANRWEIQIDTASGEVLQSVYRRSDLIESLHDGSFFGDGAKLLIFLPSGVILLGLWCTGVYLWLLILYARSSGRRRREHVRLARLAAGATQRSPDAE
jgi:uncharacterized iron-regulated membrane protein